MNAPDDTGEGCDAPRSGATIRGSGRTGRGRTTTCVHEPVARGLGTPTDDTDLDDAELDDDLGRTRSWCCGSARCSTSEDLTTTWSTSTALRGRSVLATGFELLGLVWRCARSQRPRTCRSSLEGSDMEQTTWIWAIASLGGGC